MHIMFKYILIVFGIISHTHAGIFNNQLYKNAKLIRIKNIPENFKNNITSDFELRFGFRIWRETNTEIDAILKPNQIENIRNYIKQNNLTINVLIDDVQKEIDTEKNSDQVETRGFLNPNMDWISYHSTDTIMNFLDDMKTQYPHLVSVFEIGKSYEGRPLKVLVVSQNLNENKKIWLDGGIHAREWISPAVTTFIANTLLSKWNTLPEHITNKTWYIMPLINPDGYEYTRDHDRFWRKNRKKDSATECYGVDLNRNWDIDWKNPRQSRSLDPCSDVYRGSEPFSEPETRAVSNFIKANSRNLEAFLTFHSYGQYILYPWGFNREKAPDFVKMDETAIRASAKIADLTGTKYKVQQSNILGLISGGSDDWAKDYFKLPYAYTIELRDTGEKGFLLPESQIISVGAEGLIIVESVANAISKDEAETNMWAWSEK